MNGFNQHLLNSKPTPSGVARQLVTFFCFTKKKVTKEKATPVCRPFGVPCVARLVRRLRNSRYALRQSSPTPPDQPPLLGGAQGKVKQKPNSTAKPPNYRWAQSAHLRKRNKVGTRAHTKPLLNFFPLRGSLDISQTSGDLGEHCLSSAVGHVLCAPPGRVAQPRLFVKYRGNPAGAAHRGRLLLVTFLGKTRKVTSCRATPDGFR
jgi:hypothetical protein